MNVGGGHSLSSDAAMVEIYSNTVLVVVVNDAIFLSRMRLNQSVAVDMRLN